MPNDVVAAMEASYTAVTGEPPPSPAPGVTALTTEREDGTLYIWTVRATNPGSGDVSRYLDGLPTDRRVIVPNVLNDKLRAMLERRGFECGEEIVPGLPPVPMHVRDAMS